MQRMEYLHCPHHDSPCRCKGLRYPIVSSPQTHGFLYDGANYTTIDSPASGETIYLLAVDGKNVVGVCKSGTNQWSSFLYDGATFKTVINPKAAYGTLANGISGTNIVGNYYDDLGISHGFLYNGQEFTTIDHPLATIGTSINAISGNRIAGWYRDSTNSHGFTGIITPE